MWESSVPDGKEYKDVLKERRRGKEEKKGTEHLFHTYSETQYYYWYCKYLLNHNQHINNCASLWPHGLRPDDRAHDNKRQQMRCTAQHA